VEVAADEVVEIVDVVAVVSVVDMMEVVVVAVEVVSEVVVAEDTEVEMVDTEVVEEEVVEEGMEVDVVVIEVVMEDVEVTVETKAVMVVVVKLTVEVVMVNSREEITTVKAVMEVVLGVDTVVLHLLHPRMELLQPNHLTTRTEVPQAPQPTNHNHLVDTDSSNPVTTALVANRATVRVNNKVTARVSNKAMVRVNNKATAVHHSNQQLQHLQVILKDTVNNNRTEQVLEDRTDINNLGPLTFVPYCGTDLQPAIGLFWSRLTPWDLKHFKW